MMPAAVNRRAVSHSGNPTTLVKQPFRAETRAASKPLDGVGAGLPPRLASGDVASDLLRRSACESERCSLTADVRREPVPASTTAIPVTTRCSRPLRRRSMRVASASSTGFAKQFAVEHHDRVGAEHDASLC